MWPTPYAGKYDTRVKKDTNQISIYLLKCTSTGMLLIDQVKSFCYKLTLDYRYSKVWQKAH